MELADSENVFEQLNLKLLEHKNFQKALEEIAWCTSIEEARMIAHRAMNVYVLVPRGKNSDH